MNGDNKYGECCQCPARTNDYRMVSNYVMPQIHIDTLMKVTGAKNNMQMKNYLQNNATSIIKATQDALNAQNRCKWQNNWSNETF